MSNYQVYRALDQDAFVMSLSLSYGSVDYTFPIIGLSKGMSLARQLTLETRGTIKASKLRDYEAEELKATARQALPEMRKLVEAYFLTKTGARISKVAEAA